MHTFHVCRAKALSTKHPFLPPLRRGGKFTEFGNDLDLPADADSYYDAEEAPRAGWIALGVIDGDGIWHLGDMKLDFEAPPQSGATYIAIFVNTPTQGCTPGFWQGGTVGGQAGGRWPWNEEPLDPDWTLSGGFGQTPTTTGSSPVIVPLLAFLTEPICRTAHTVDCPFFLTPRRESGIIDSTSFRAPSTRPSLGAHRLHLACGAAVRPWHPRSLLPTSLRGKTEALHGFSVYGPIVAGQ